jgi:hypothetical protein
MYCFPPGSDIFLCSVQMKMLQVLGFCSGIVEVCILGYGAMSLVDLCQML